jgi:hypothetical protein
MRNGAYNDVIRVVIPVGHFWRFADGTPHGQCYPSSVRGPLCKRCWAGGLPKRDSVRCSFARVPGSIGDTCCTFFFYPFCNSYLSYLLLPPSPLPVAIYTSLVIFSSLCKPAVRVSRSLCGQFLRDSVETLSQGPRDSSLCLTAAHPPLPLPDSTGHPFSQSRWCC